MLIDCLLVLNSEEEKKQFTEIYEREYIILIKFAINKLGNSNDAEDAVSEGFLRFAKNFQKYSQKSCSEIHALLVTIVRNIIIDHYRVSDRMVYRGDGPEKDEAFLDEVAFRYDEADNPEKQYITKEATKRMITAIDALTAETKETFLMRYYAGLTPEEISKRINTPVKTIQQRLYRAQVQLRKDLEENE